MKKRYVIREIAGVGWGLYEITDTGKRKISEYRWESQAQYVADRSNEMLSEMEAK